MPKDLRSLPKLRDSITFLYVEHAILEQDDMAIVMIRKEGRTSIPIASMTTLMIGPGVSVTHAAIKAIADNGCMVVWCGEHAAKFYAFGTGETRSAQNLLLQARCCMDEKKHIEVVRRLYIRRFENLDCENMTLEQIRGLEGIRMRETYRQLAKIHGVNWSKRSYKQDDWDKADPINRAISYANTILYSICQAAIISLGFSTGLGFIHTGKMLSFVYDVADLYKADTTLPAAFSVIARFGEENMDKNIRRACREAFRSHKLLDRLPKDIFWVLQETETKEVDPGIGSLWDGENKVIPGGKNHGEVLK